MWSQPKRAPEIQALYDAADLASKPGDRRFDVDQLMEKVRPTLPELAQEPTGWEEPLRRYLEAVEAEGRLNGLGFQSVGATVGGRLQSRYNTLAVLERNPAIRSTVIDRPIFVIGGWRTGTTLLQRLLSAIPDLRGLLPAELTQPWRFEDPAAGAAFLDAAQKTPNVLHQLNPGIMDIHPYGPDQEEECVLALGTDFKNLSFTSNVHVPSYAHWLLQQDMTDSYAIYADILRILHRNDARRLILKAPAHTASLPAIWANFPDAIVVQLHRDVVHTVTSGASLFSVFHSTYSDHVDAAEVGRYQMEMTKIWFDRASAARDAHPGKTFIDVDFRTFIADPVAMVAEICRLAQVSWDEQGQEAVERRLVTLNRQHAAHRYTPEDFGLTAEEIREHLGAYAARYGV